jgi:hypothetical protein
MAHVRLTDSLKRTILINLESRFSLAMGKLMERLAALPIYDDALDAAIPAAEQALANKLGTLNADWLTATDEGRVTFDVMTPHGRFNFAIDAALKRPPPRRFVPRRLANFYSSNAKYPTTAPSYAEAKPLIDQYTAIQHDRNNTIKAIKELLASCPSLKVLLEHWPSALDYVDDATKQQHIAPNPKRSTEKREIAAVDDSVKAAIVKTRLLTGT